MSPILIRPIREQIEHDRIIRVLQARLRKQYDVEANIGEDRRVPVRVGLQTLYPDLVLTAIGAPRKVQAIIEVETTESVNYLEAMAEWAHYAKAKAPFHLYVPQTLVDIARKLLETHQITVDQLWSYAPLGDQVHFWLVSSNGDGTVVTSVTDSILIAEPAPPAAGPDEPSGEAPPPAPAEDAKPSAARAAATVTKAAPAPAKKPAAAAASKPARPAQAAKPAKVTTTAKPARPKPASRSVGGAKPAAKRPVIPAAKARPAAQPKASRPAGKARPKVAAARPKAKTRPAAPARSKTAKSKRR